MKDGARRGRRGCKKAWSVEEILGIGNALLAMSKVVHGPNIL